MREVRTIKMVEVTDIVFFAEDGTQFVGDNAEKACRDYERTCDKNKVKAAFERLTYRELDIPLMDWFSCESACYRVELTCKSDYVAMMDYLTVCRDVCEIYINEPTVYPHTMFVIDNCGYIDEYRGDLEVDCKKLLEQLK